MKVYLGADHGGLALNNQVAKWLADWGYNYQDLGPSQYDENDDYPEVAFRVATQVAQDPGARSILVCRSGGGMAIAANKVKGARAVAVGSSNEAQHAVSHNNANVISLAGDWLTEKQAQEIVKTYLDTKFSQEERHARRLKKIADYESTSSSS